MIEEFEFSDSATRGMIEEIELSDGATRGMIEEFELSDGATWGMIEELELSDSDSTHKKWRHPYLSEALKALDFLANPCSLPFM